MDGSKNGTLREFATQWLDTIRHLKPSTLVSYEGLLRLHILPVFGEMAIAAIARHDVQVWIAGLCDAGCAAGTVRNAYRVLARLLDEAQLYGLIDHNPARRVPLPASPKQEMRLLGPAEIVRLADAMAKRYRALVLMAGFTGLRWGEIAALRHADLDLERGVVFVRRAHTEAGSGRLRVVTPKSGRERTVPLPPFLCEELAKHLECCAGPNGLVFGSPRGGPLRRNNFYVRQFKPALRRAGLPEGVRFHDLRHSAASIAIASGANVKQVQQMLGHASATVTLDTYAHVFPSLAEQLRENLEAAYRATVRARKV